MFGFVMAKQGIVLGVAVLVGLIGQSAAERTVNGRITGYGAASNDPPGSSTICCGREGSEHSATYDDPGVCATDNKKFPVNTRIYVPGLQKYFLVQDSCADCEHDAVHFDLWVGPTGYQNMGNLESCAGKITTSNADVVVDPDPGKPVDRAPLMDSSGHCGNRTPNDSPVSGGGGSGSGSGGDNSPQGGLGGNREHTTLATSVRLKSTGTPKASNTQPACSWEGHCLGAKCTGSNDCADPYPCVGGKCVELS